MLYNADLHTNRPFRLSFPSCTYGSTRARERWKYESSFEHLVGESRPPHEVSYDSRLARAKAATWQIKCLSDDQFRALIHWYLAWDHPSNPLFDEEHLLNALDSGSNERCNLVLMHMVLAFATVCSAKRSISASCWLTSSRNPITSGIL